MDLFGIPVNIGTNFMQALGWALINSLWQMAFLWVFYQIILSFGVYKPSAKNKLAVVLLFTGFGWFLFNFFYHWLISPAPFLFSLAVLSPYSNQWNESLPMLLPYASLAYLIMLVVPVAKFFRNYRFIQLLRQKGLSKCSVDLRIFIKNFSERIGIRKKVKLYISEFISSPVTIGFLKPVILIPLAAINNLSQKQMEAVLLHELAHIYRCDFFINLITNFIRTILYFNPFVKLFTGVIEKEREKSCDEVVMQFEYDAHGYASALLVLEQNNFKEHAMAMAAAGKRNHLLHRIERILKIEKPSGRNFQKLAGLLAGLVCMAIINMLFLVSSPSIHRHDLMASFPNPFYHFVTNDNDQNIYEGQPPYKSPLAIIKKEIPVAAQSPKKQFVPVKKIQQPDLSQVTLDKPAAPPSPFINAANLIAILPELNREQEQQVKTVVAETKKVLQQQQWKEVEKNIADAMTQVEKENLKAKYYNDLEKVNWNQIETQLRLAYDRVNWNRVNTQLSSAMNNMKLDSLHEVYDQALEKLSLAEEWMNENKCVSIPDTDLKLPEVKEQKQKLQQQLKTLNAIRHKKIIHL